MITEFGLRRGKVSLPGAGSEEGAPVWDLGVATGDPLLLPGVGRGEEAAKQS